MEATLEPRLVMRSQEGTPYADGEFSVTGYQRGRSGWACAEVSYLTDQVVVRKSPTKRC